MEGEETLNKRKTVLEVDAKAWHHVRAQGMNQSDTRVKRLQHMSVAQ